MPVDFKALTEKMQNKTGKCFLPTTSYDWVDGYKVNCVTGAKTAQKVYYLIENDGSGYCIKFLNGVTGFESFYIKDILEDREHPIGFWAACCETKNRWDGLYVSARQVQEKLQSLPFINEILN